jgi:hypothetical protein
VFGPSYFGGSYFGRSWFPVYVLQGTILTIPVE